MPDRPTLIVVNPSTPRMRRSGLLDEVQAAAQAGRVEVLPTERADHARAFCAARADQFDKIIVAVAVNPAKDPLFTTKERVELIEKCLSKESQVEADSFTGLLVEYAQRRGAHAILRGLRAVVSGR